MTVPETSVVRPAASGTGGRVAAGAGGPRDEVRGGGRGKKMVGARKGGVP